MELTLSVTMELRDDKKPRISEEYAGAELGDRRRVKRLIQLAQALDQEPSASLPDATQTDAGLEGAYRLLSNSAVSAEGILAGHFQQTVERAAAQSWVLAVHDTTIFEFSGDGTRTGLGPLRSKGQGFLAHFTLLVAPGTMRRPLGVISLETVVRKARKGKKKRIHAGRHSGPTERDRWHNGVRTTEERLNGCTRVIHVMDREGDCYRLWAQMVIDGARFVIRSNHDRSLTQEGGKQQLSDAVATASVVVERTVTLSPRKEEKIIFNRKRHPMRSGRLAKLALSAMEVTFLRPRQEATSLPEALAVNVVHVKEVETNGTSEPVEWTLLTTESIATATDIERIVDAYRSRWVIEEYFKSIKTGCAFEKRQLESLHSLLNALAVLVPIAWRLLLLRTTAREQPDAPATEVLTTAQVEILIATSNKPLPRNLTVHQALLAVAGLGGHIKNNGAPGWQVLGRGYEKLLLLEQGWLIASKRSDQS